MMVHSKTAVLSPLNNGKLVVTMLEERYLHGHTKIGCAHAAGLIVKFVLTECVCQMLTNIT